MNSGAGDTTQLVPGFPIRTPSDDSSPRPIAASHVLHRLLVPRHPPYALSNLTTKMLASTVQFSTNATPPQRTHASQQDRIQRPQPPHPHDHMIVRGLFSQDPTGCPPPPPPQPAGDPSTPPQGAVLDQQ